jgi:molecular chaperone GrpE
VNKNRVKPSESDEPICATAKEAKAKGEPDPEVSPPTPEERIAAVEGEKAEIHDRMLRIAADFENWKKRARKDQADGEMRAKESVLRDFLEVVDGLERATALWADGNESDAKSIMDGVESVLLQFRSKLERYEVKPIEAAGLPFDPRMHEAVSQVPSAAVKPGFVLHELQKGYVIGEKLLRPARVVVAAAPSAERNRRG